jgi:hypothetical protein
MMMCHRRLVVPVPAPAVCCRRLDEHDASGVVVVEAAASMEVVDG